MTFFLELEPYLAEWFIFHSGGEVPVKLAKGSLESRYLEILISKPPKGSTLPVSKRGVEIEIPAYRNKPAMYWWYLSPRGQQAIAKIIRTRFDYQLWTEVHKISGDRELQRDILYAWMEANGIEPTGRNWDAVAKRYQRLRKKASDKESQQKRRGKNAEKNV